MLKHRKLNSQFRVTLRNIGSYKNKNFKEKGSYYIKSQQMGQKKRLPYSQKSYLKNNKSFRSTAPGKSALNLLKLVPYFMLRAGGTGNSI